MAHRSQQEQDDEHEKGNAAAGADEADAPEISREYFEGKGYETACAFTLFRARFYPEEQAPGLILPDVMLPDGSGFDFCGGLRKKQTLPFSS